MPDLRRRASETFWRSETWQLVVELDTIEEPHTGLRNVYPDRFRLGRFAWHRAPDSP